MVEVFFCEFDFSWTTFLATSTLSFAFSNLFFFFFFESKLYTGRLLPVTFNVFPANTYLFKVKNRFTRKKCEISSKLTIKKPERRLTVLYPDTNINVTEKYDNFVCFALGVMTIPEKLVWKLKQNKKIMKTASICYTNLCHNESKSSKQRPTKIFQDHCPKNWSFTLRTSPVNVTKSAGNCRFSHIDWNKTLNGKLHFFPQWVCWAWTLTSKQHKSLPATNERNMEKQ